MTSGVGSVIFKIIRSLQNDLPTNPKLKTRCNLEALDRFKSILPGLLKLNNDILTPKDNLWGPVCGDMHPGNFVFFENLDDILFYDFGLFQLSTVLVDFHGFSIAQPFLEPHTGQLLEAFITSFLSVTNHYQLPMSRDTLIAE